MILTALLVIWGLVLIAYGISILVPDRSAVATNVLRRFSSQVLPWQQPVPRPVVARVTRPAQAARPWTAVRLLAVAAPIAIVLGAFVIRAIDLTGSPPGFYVDEASNALDSYSIATTLHDQHGVLLPAYFEALGDWRGSLYIYWNVPFVAVFGMTEFAIRLGSAVMGAITVGLVYLFLNKVTNRGIALAAAFLLATSPWHIMQSRIGWDIITVPFLTALCLTFLYYGFERPRLLPFAFISCALGMYGYFAGRLFFPMFCLIWVVIYRNELWGLRRYAGIGLGISAIIVIPAMVSFANGTLSARFSQVQGPSPSLADELGAFVYNYLAHFQPSFLFDSSNYWILRLYVRGFGMLYGVEIPFLIIGVVAMLLRHRKADILFLAWLLIYPIPAALAGPPFSTRSIPGVIVFQIAVAQGVFVAVRFAQFAVRTLLSRLRRSSSERGTAIVASILLAAVGISTAAGFMVADLRDYPTYAAGWDGWQAGADQIVAYFEAHRGEYDRMIMSSDFNAADEMLKFYALGYPDQCANCTVINTDDQLALRLNYTPGERELWALTPVQFEGSRLAVSRHKVVGQLSYPGGDTSFVFVATGPGA